MNDQPLLFPIPDEVEAHGEAKVLAQQSNPQANYQAAGRHVKSGDIETPAAGGSGHPVPVDLEQTMMDRNRRIAERLRQMPPKFRPTYRRAASRSRPE